jgi:hypothetical protein
VALAKSQRGVEQKYLKLMPPANSPSKASSKKGNSVEWTEEMKLALLSAVARGKPTFWQGIAKHVGNNVSAAQCEQEWNEQVKNRK